MLLWIACLHLPACGSGLRPPKRTPSQGCRYPHWHRKPPSLRSGGHDEVFVHEGWWAWPSVSLVRWPSTLTFSSHRLYCSWCLRWVGFLFCLCPRCLDPIWGFGGSSLPCSRALLSPSTLERWRVSFGRFPLAGSPWKPPCCASYLRGDPRNLSWNLFPSWYIGYECKCG